MSGAPSQPLLNMVTASRRGCVHVVNQSGGEWLSTGLDDVWPKDEEGVLSVLPLPTLRCFLAVKNDAVDLVNLEDHEVLHNFPLDGMVPSSLRCFHTAPSGPSGPCVSVQSFSLIYTDKISGSCKLLTYSPGNKYEGICIDDRQLVVDSTSCAWSSTSTKIHEIEQPGNWEVLQIGVVIGVRKSAPSSILLNEETPLPTSRLQAMLRQRKSPNVTKQASYEPDSWEAWMLSFTGDTSTVSLSQERFNATSIQLLAATCGPICRIGQRSIAVGLGNLVKIITVGHEHFDAGVEMADDLAAAVAARRRKPLGARKACSTKRSIQ